MKNHKPKKYQAPRLEQHASYTLLTGVSLPIGTNTLPDLELGNFGKDK
jgi:hypothetical protein